MNNYIKLKIFFTELIVIYYVTLLNKMYNIYCVNETLAGKLKVNNNNIS